MEMTTSNQTGIGHAVDTPASGEGNGGGGGGHPQWRPSREYFHFIGRAYNTKKERMDKKMDMELFVAFRSSREFFIHMQTSPLPVKGYKFMFYLI